jgi:hemerythrin-like domain-containing protein
MKKFASYDLTMEHGSIIFGLNVLEKMAVQTRKTDKADIEDYSRMVEFLKVFADKCHHGKEEDLYFPAVVETGDESDRALVAELLGEHVQGRNFIAQIVESIKGPEADIPSLLAASTGYITLLHMHIKKETAVLFPIGDKKIPPDIQRQISESYVRFERNVMGEGLHKKFHVLLHELDGKYKK